MNRAADTATQPTAFERIRHWWRRLAATVLPARGEPESDRATARVLDEFGKLVEECRAQRGGELSTRRRAEQIRDIYRAADLPRRAAILDVITSEFAPDQSQLESAIIAMQGAATDADLSHAEAQLRLALGHPRAQFFIQFNLLPDGVKFLVDLRADVLRLLPETPALEVLKVELDALIASWFDPGFLELRRITWESPALILEKLMTYEAVHAIESWNHLRDRLDTDRRCYAFFHARMPDEPLIFVEIALLKGFPASVQALLDVNAPAQNPRSADTAIFYSISNTQRGLHGVSMGNLLLKRVTEDLQRNLPGLKVFATLSPIPGLRKWAERILTAEPGLVGTSEAAKIAAELADTAPESALQRALGRDDWASDERLREVLRAPLEKLCARYLLKEKSGTRPIDPVAAFHLNNGARVNRLLWLADTSARGMKQSYGLMVSYRYDLREVDDNHERFAHSGEIVAARRVKRLVD
ncbi:MAG: malonyl-CoA decarboxylase [Betaproteobacteria bacterium]|nr:malonyl-CoA decarboxylase [Betaproteobacteria bacterium]